MTEHPTPTPTGLLGRPGSLGTATVIRGNARHLPLADNTVDLCVSSPPYWSLRAYQDNGETYDGQIGAEPTPGEFVDSLIEVTRELVRVTKPSGSIWINLGDKYNAYNGNRGEGTIQANGIRQSTPKGNGLDVKSIQPKSLIGLPWRYALRCIDDLGLILRAEIILDKRNGLPESVTDRVRRNHEQVFHFVKEPRYFSAVDEIREPHTSVADPRWLRATTPSNPDRNDGGVAMWRDGKEPNPLGKLPGSVWPYTSEPFQPPAHLGVDHFAAFATALPRQIILGWSPVGVCTGCGQGRRPVTHAQRTLDGDPVDLGGWKRGGVQEETAGVGNWRFGTDRSITGYACGCAAPTIPVEVTEFDYEVGEMVTRVVDRPDPLWVNPAPTTPSVILDPFGGTGTTALVAKALGRHGISVDMSLDYGRLARWRTNDLDQLAKVQGIKRSDQARLADGLDMDTLFDFDGGAA